jgi:CRP-like cAMP-binding protein
VTTPLLAAGYGILAASGLVLGALVGLWARPAHRVVAAVMAFGSGTLLSAVAFDLCEEAFHKGGAVVVVCGFILGGLVFVTAEAAIDSKGGFLRREGTREVFLKGKKAERAADILERLSEVPLVQALPPAEVQAIVPYVQEREYQDGQVVFEKGETGDALYLLVEGEVEVTDGGRVIATLSKGSAFGEMAILSGAPRNATVRAAGPTRVYRIARDDFNHLLTHSRELAEGVQRLLQERIDAREKQGDPEAAQTWRRVATANLDRHLSTVEEKALIEEHAGSSAPVAIFLGALVDGVPESLVIGATMIGTQSPSLSFLVAVFLSNFPEAMSSASGMTKAGFSQARILGMWFGLALLSGIAALMGNAFLSGASGAVVAFAESLAAGGILALLANTMMPEAFELGGRLVAFSTIVGFLVAFLLAVMH